MTAPDLYDLLDSLGGTADIIAARLFAEGCLGQRSDAAACPISRWLVKETGASVAIVGMERVTLLFASIPDSVECETPPSIQGFLARFHRGMFPELVSSKEAIEANH